MITGLYSAATAMDAAAQRHEVTAENLANLQMPGFRRRILPQTTFEKVLADADTASIRTEEHRLGTAPADLTYDFEPGPLQQTGRRLDVAINGDAFFTIEGPDGQNLFTRSGAFQVSQDGRLTTIDGLTVVGDPGDIVIPQGVSTESVEITADGRVFAGGANVGKIALHRFDDPTVLQSVGASLFASADDTAAIPVDQEVLQGFLEGANVSAMHEMVELISVNRNYEAAQRVMMAIAEMSRQRIGL